MRQVKIEKGYLTIADDKDGIWCPMSLGFGKGKCSDCSTYCAWFRITCKEIDKKSEREEDENNNKYAYCGDKLIGKIVKETMQSSG